MSQCGDRSGLRPLNPKLWGALVHCAAAYTGSARPQALGARVAVSDRSPLGGLTQFFTQFGFAGSSTRS
jgi:hypothetical protein